MRQSRLRIKELRKALTQGSADAALLLLAHSRSLGHGRLAVRRYFSARFLGAEGLEPFQPYCAEAASRIAPADLIEIARDAARGEPQLRRLFADRGFEVQDRHAPVRFSRSRAKAGGQGPRRCARPPWAPAFAGEQGKEYPPIASGDLPECIAARYHDATAKGMPVAQ